MNRFCWSFLLACLLVTRAMADDDDHDEEKNCKKFILPDEKSEFEELLAKYSIQNEEEEDKDTTVLLCDGHDDAPEGTLAHALNDLSKDVKEVLLQNAVIIEKVDHKTKELEERMDSVEKTVVTVGPRDCSDIRADGATRSGVYRIYPNRYSCVAPLSVWCDMEEEDGGGWTVFLNRGQQDNQLNFYQNWIMYRAGFGLPIGEYYIGNENLHRMTSSRDYVVRLEAIDYQEDTIKGEWRTFHVDSEANQYRLTVGDYNDTSSADNALFSAHNGMQFSTFDRDNDAAVNNCAVVGHSGFWHNNCVKINPTGVFGTLGLQGIQFFEAWSRTDSSTHYAKRLQLKIRPAIYH